MSDVTAINNLVKKYSQLKLEIAKVIVGQEAVIEEVLLAILPLPLQQKQVSLSKLVSIRLLNPIKRFLPLQTTHKVYRDDKNMNQRPKNAGEAIKNA